MDRSADAVMRGTDHLAERADVTWYMLEAAMWSGDHARADALTDDQVRLRAEMGEQDHPYAVFDFVTRALNASMARRHSEALEILDSAPLFDSLSGSNPYAATLGDIIKWTRARILVDQGRAAVAWQLVGKLEPHDLQSLEGGISSRRALHAELKCLMGQPRAGRDALERLADAIARDHYEHSPEPAWLRAKAGLCSVAAGDRARARALAGKVRSAFDAQPQVSAYFKAPLVELERSLYRAPRSTPGGVPLVD